MAKPPKINSLLARIRKQQIKIGTAPVSVENSYMIAMRKLIKPLADDLKELQQQGINGVDDVREKWNSPDFLKKAEELAQKFVTTSVNEAEKRTIGLDVLANNQEVSNLVDIAARDNFRLIKSLPNNVIDKAEGVLLRAARDGIRYESTTASILELIQPKAPKQPVKPDSMSDDEFSRILDEINDTFNAEMQKARNRAKLIARDQAAKINGQVARARQQGAGFKYFRWSTSKDVRVRDRHEHIAEFDAGFGEGIYRWDALPLSDAGEPIYPGKDIQCRCVAIPVFEDEIKTHDE